MGFEYSTNELYHHGIKGQKWGIRRYQNEDGSLTAEGQKRYGSRDNYEKGVDKVETAARRFLTNRAMFGRYKGMSGGDVREQRLQRRSERLAEKKSSAVTAERKAKLDKKLEKTNSKLEAQKAHNLNMKAYEAHSSTAKLFAQEFVLGPLGAMNYRSARAAGAGQARAFVEGLVTSIPITSTVLKLKRQKEAYGHAIVHDAVN